MKGQSEIMVEPGTITHRTVEFTVEFVNSGAITMGLVNKTVGFIDVLLIEYLKKEMATDSVIEDLDVALYDTETMLNGICKKEKTTLSQETTFKQHCWKMSTEITSFQSHGDSDEDALIAQSHKGLIDFVIADHTRAYFQNHMYPIFLQDLQITFVGPLWVSARHIGLHLTGKFPAKQILNSSNQGSLKVAVIDFLSSPPSQGTMLSDTKDSDVFISQLVLSEGVSQAPEIRGRDANRNLNVTLKFDLTFFQQLPQKMQSQGYGALSYRDSVISRFNTETQQFLFEFLKTSGPFFEGVSNARAVDNIDFPTQDPEILQPALEPSSKNPSYKSFLSKTGNSFDVRFATILMVLVPIIILVIGGALVLYLQRKKKRVK